MVVSPAVPVAANIQIIGSSSPRRDGLALLDFRHFQKSQAVGRKARGDIKAVRGEVMDVSKMTAGAPK
jgi:hypothetical protein